MAKKTGGRAFPVTNANFGNTAPGMTLRDYFAAQALVGLLADPHDDDDGLGFGDRYASAMASGAYMLADAMLAEREKE